MTATAHPATDGSSAGGDADPVVRATERWFIRRGVPLFVEHYNAATDVWTRALPFLLIWFLVGVVLTPVAAGGSRGVVGFAIALVVILVAYAVANAVRRQPWWRLPTRVSTAGLLVWFVGVPAVLAAAAGYSLGDVAVTLIGQLVILAVVYLLTRYALISLSWWAIRRVVRQFGDIYRLSTRALPLLLLVTTFLFINTEVWQVAGSLPALLLWATVGFFIVLAVLFLAGQLPAELSRIDAGTSTEAVVAACERTPLADVAPRLEGLAEPCELAPAQRRNLLLVMLVAQGAQVGLVALAVYGFFLAFGVVAITIPVQQAWLGVDAAGLDPFVTFGDAHALTRPLVRVATFLAGFASLYVTVSAVNDATYRAAFFEQVTAEIERLVRVRRAYLAHRRAVGA